MLYFTLEDKKAIIKEKLISELEKVKLPREDIKLILEGINVPIKDISKNLDELEKDFIMISNRYPNELFTIYYHNDENEYYVIYIQEGKKYEVAGEIKYLKFDSALLIKAAKNYNTEVDHYNCKWFSTCKEIEHIDAENCDGYTEIN